MNVLVLLCGGIGIALVVTSVPPIRDRGYRLRLEPFLDGLKGRPSSLLRRQTSIPPTWLAEPLAALGLLRDAGLARRLEAAGRDPDEGAFRIEQILWGGMGFAIAVATGVGLAAAGLIRISPLLGIVAGIATATGALGRDWFLAKEIERRREAFRDELPTAIDHLTLALLAGDSVAVAFARIAQEASGVVGQEFARVDADIRAGAPVVDALEAFRSRIPDASVARFVDALCSAIERGTSLSEVLRAQADDVREARRRHLLALGGRREILMLVPVVFLIMPVVVLFALYPGLVSLDLLVR